MRAVWFDQHGGPEVLRAGEVPDPPVGAGEVRVRVRACGLNHLDIWTRRGLERIEVPLPHIPGCDISGEVETVGEGVTGWAVGDPVLVHPLEVDGTCPACRAAQEQRCRASRFIGGYDRDGGYAELVTVSARSLVRRPPGLGAVEGAAIPVAFTTAWHMLVDKGKATAGDDVLVAAATGGVASAAVQLAVARGCRVIATASTPEKAAAVRALGVDDVLVGRELDHRAVRELTGGKGVEVALDHVGGALVMPLVRSLAAGGRLVTTGASAGHRVEVDLRYLYSRDLDVRGAFLGPHRALGDALAAVDRAGIRPLLHTTFPLEDAAAAQQVLEDRAVVGKVVLVIG